MAKYLTIDIGGTYIKYALVDEQLHLIDKGKVATKRNMESAILQQVDEIIEKFLSVSSINGVGISTAGIVDRQKGEIVYAGPTIKNYKGTSFKKHIVEKFDLPVHVENDVNAALLGEIWKGAAQHHDQVYCITLGTGIGGAYYDEGIVDGYHLQAHSVGYLLYDPASKTNYEMRASTSALSRKVVKELGTDFTVQDAFDKAKLGDVSCTDMIRDWCKEVSRGISEIILLVDPSCIIIGGGISQQGDFLLHFIEEQVEEFLPSHFLKTEIKMAQLYNDAALYGAVYPFFKEEK